MNLDGLRASQIHEILPIHLSNGLCELICGYAKPDETDLADLLNTWFQAGPLEIQSNLRRKYLVDVLITKCNQIHDAVKSRSIKRNQKEQDERKNLIELWQDHYHHLLEMLSLVDFVIGWGTLSGYRDALLQFKQRQTHVFTIELVPRVIFQMED